MNKKALIEKKNSLLDEMEQLLEAAATETRALSSDEEKVYNEKKGRGVETVDHNRRNR